MTAKLLLKLTVTADEMPELFRVLVSVQDPRRRTTRLKALAAQGLLVERTGGVANAAMPRPAESAARSLQNMPAEFTGSSFAHGFDGE
jgi:hypothetical protein